MIISAKSLSSFVPLKNVAFNPNLSASELNINVMFLDGLRNGSARTQGQVAGCELLVVFDARVSDLPTLLGAVVEGAGRFVLSENEDAITVITQLLAQTGARRLALVAHGEPGVVHIGATPLDMVQLERRSGLLQEWGVEEIALYSCEVAKGEMGHAFIHHFSQLTQASIAASETKTGAAALEGNWNLEVKTGDVTPDLAFQPSGLAAYASVLAAGDLDLTFGIGGKVTTDFNNNDTARDVIVQPDGKIVVAGSAGNYNDFALSRYNSDGSLDLTFGTGGKVTTDFSTPGFVFSVLQQSDGKIAVASYAYNFNSGNNDFALRRYNSDGSLDLTFGTGGKVTTDFNGSTDIGTSVLQQSDGKIVVTGYTFDPSGRSDFALSRYNSDGSLDSTFGAGGKVTTDFNGNDDDGYSVLQQNDGKIVVAGYAVTPSLGSTDFALSRYNSDGSLDLTFGTGGKVTTDFNGSEDSGLSVLQQSDGKIVVAGRAVVGSPDFALSRYNSDGSLDLTFGTGGKVTTDFNGSTNIVFSVLQQSDGKIVVAGRAYRPNGDFALSRYNSDGSLDLTFGTGGKVTTDFNNSDDSGYSLALQPDGNIILVGTSGGNFAIARYLGGNQPNQPINTVPGAQSVNEDTSLSITGISVTDGDNNLSTTQLTVTNGMLNVDLTGGASISAGSNSSATLTLSGTQTQINAALATLRYIGNANFNGSDTLTVVSIDSTGTPLSDTDIVNITINGINDAPIITSFSDDTGVSSSDRITKDNTLTLTGIAEANSTIELFNGAVGFGTTTTNSLGAWNLTTATLSDGTYNLIALATDSASNISSFSAPLTVTVDTTAAAPTLSLAIDSGSSSTDKITNSGIVNVGGLETGATWEYSANNGATWLTGSGNSFTLSGKRIKNAVVRQTDLAGNTSSNSAPFTFTLDTVAPTKTATVTAMTLDSGTSTTDFLTNNGSAGRIYNGTLSANLSVGKSLQISVDGGTTWANATVSSRNWSFTDNTSKNSNWTIQTRVVDPAGNGTIRSKAVTLDQQISAASTITLDLLASSDSGSSTTDNVTNLGLSTFAIAFDPTKAQIGDILEVRKGTTILGSTILTATEVSAGTANVTLTVALTNGANTLSAVHRDAAGNSVIGSSTLAVTLDTAAPAAANIIGYTTTSIVGTTEPNAMVLLSTSASAPNTFAATATAAANGSYTLNTSTLDGSNAGTTYYLYAQDVAGNLSSLNSSQKVIVGTSGADSLINVGSTAGDLLGGSLGADTAQYAVASNVISLTGQVTGTNITSGSINIRTANIDVLTGIETLQFAGSGYSGVGTGANQLRSGVQTALSNNSIAAFTGAYDAATGIFTLGSSPSNNATLVTFDSNAGSSTNYETFLLLDKTSIGGGLSVGGGTVTLGL